MNSIRLFSPVGVTIALLCAGCGSVAVDGPKGNAAPQLPAAMGRSPVEPVANYKGTFTASVEFSNLAVHIDPPPTDATPSISWQEAYALCGLKGSAAVCDDQSSPDIRLGLVTSDNGARIADDGRITPTLDHTLAFVLMWDKVPCVPAGGPPGTGHTETTCLLVNLVDAKSGEFLGAGQTSAPGG